MEHEYQIPGPSLQRLVAAMQQFEQLAAVIAEGMGIPAAEPRRLNLERGVFITGGLVPNGVIDEAP